MTGYRINNETEKMMVWKTKAMLLAGYEIPEIARHLGIPKFIVKMWAEN